MSDDKLRPYQKEFLDKLMDEMTLPLRVSFKDMKFGKPGAVSLPKYSAKDLQGKAIAPFLLLDPAEQYARSVFDTPSTSRPVFGTMATSRYRKSTPRTDDMIQMIADLEAHGYGRKRIVIIVRDEVSDVIRQKHEQLQEMARLAAIRGR